MCESCPEKCVWLFVAGRSASPWKRSAPTIRRRLISRSDPGGPTAPTISHSAPRISDGTRIRRTTTSAAIRSFTWHTACTIPPNIYLSCHLSDQRTYLPEQVHVPRPGIRLQRALVRRLSTTPLLLTCGLPHLSIREWDLTCPELSWLGLPAATTAWVRERCCRRERTSSPTRSG